MKKSIRKALSLILTLAIVIGLIPAFTIGASAAPADIARATVFTYAQGNIARDPAIRAAGFQPLDLGGPANVGIYANYTNETYNSPRAQSLPRIIDGAVVNSTDQGEAMNTWGSNAFPVEGGWPVWISLTWPTPQTIDATRVMWWTDENSGTINNSSTGYGMNGKARLQYWDGTAWLNVPNQTDYRTGNAVTALPHAFGTYNAQGVLESSEFNTAWNIVTFPPITTTRLRIVLGSHQNVFNGAGNQCGIGEWEVFGTPRALDDDAERATVEFYLRSFYKTHKVDKTIFLDINWSDELFSQSAMSANNDLAIASLVLSQAAYDEARAQRVLNKLGFDYEDIEQDYDLSQSFRENRVAHSFAHKRTDIGGEDTVLVAVVLRGTPPDTSILTEQEWRANLFLPFEGAADSVKTALDSYMTGVQKKHPDLSISDYEDVKFLVTGHSRGAAVANLLAVKLKDELPQKNVFAYCFASPNTVLDPGDYSHSFYHPNIINLLNEDDSVCSSPVTRRVSVPMSTGYLHIPLVKQGISVWFRKNFSRYEANFKDSFFQLTGIEYKKSKHAHSLDTYLAWLLSNRTLTPDVTSGGTKAIKINCPVDFEVYNSSGELVGSVSGNEVEDRAIADDVFIWVDGDEKNIVLAPNEEYAIKMFGTAEGTMNLSIVDVDMGKGDFFVEKEFSSVALFDGKEMVSHVGGGIEVPDVQLLVIDGSEITAKILDDGTEIPFTDAEAFSADKDALTWDAIKGDNALQDNVISDLRLPVLGAYGTVISWDSSDPATISETGEVTRPATGSSNKTVTLTATTTYGEISDSVTFILIVIEQPEVTSVNYDINRDGTIDYEDLAFILYSFGARALEIDPEYGKDWKSAMGWMTKANLYTGVREDVIYEDLDVVDDKVIDLIDIVALIKRFTIEW